MISRVQGLKRKMESLHEEEKKLHTQSRKRISHLEDMHNIATLDEDAYDRWSVTRLDRLLIDYLLRSGYGESARQLAEVRDVEDLVDIDVFRQCWRIEESLKNGSTAECLAWCVDNKVTLKKQNVCFSFFSFLPAAVALMR